MNEVEDIAYNNYIQYTIINLGCIKKTTVGAATIASIEAKARTIDAIRKDVEKLFLSKNGQKGAFSATAYSAHITIGASADQWTEIDLNQALKLTGVCVADAIPGDPMSVIGDSSAKAQQ